MSWKVFGDRIVLKRHEGVTETEAGIVIPNSSKEVPARGDVVQSAVEGIEVGDVVHFPRYAGIEIQLGGENLLILEKTEIVIVEPKESRNG